MSEPQIFLAFGDDSVPHIAVSRAHIPEDVTSKAALLATLAAQLDFPDYFGNNWDAFEECIRDLSWLPHGRVVITHADLPLVGDPLNAKTYLAILNDSVRKMSRSEDHPLAVTFPVKHRDQVMWLLRASQARNGQPK